MKTNEIIQTLRTLLVPIVGIVVLGAITFFGGTFMYNKIVELRDQITVARDEESALRTKLDVLTKFSLQGADMSRKVAIAFPENNSSLAVISQLRLSASTLGVSADQIKVGKGIAEDNLVYVDIDFSTHADMATTLTFLESLKKVAPLGLLRGVKISFVGADGEGVITYRTYWSALPTEVAPVGAAISDFSEEDRKIIQQLTALIPPETVNVAPNTPGENLNPFGL